MQVPVAKPHLTEAEARAAHDAILTGWITQGPKVAEFEEAFARYVGAQHAVAVSNCTTALHLALLVAGVKPGDEVICPSMSFIATANAIKHAGATPVFAEVDRQAFNLDPIDAERRITPKTRAILLVHQLGMPAPIEKFQDLCNRKGLKLIEDAACAAGTAYRGKKIGAHSELVCFSFHPRKVITTGDGGMIATSNPEYAARLKLLRQHGMSVNDRQRHASKTVLNEEYVEVGYNYRMTDIQGAVGLEQLKRLEAIVSERRKIADFYHRAWADLPGAQLPQVPEGGETNWQTYVVTLPKDMDRQALMQALLDRGIATRRNVMTSHREPAYREECRGLKLPVSEEASDRGIVVPLYVPMSQAEQEYVVREFRDAYLKARGPR